MCKSRVYSISFVRFLVGYFRSFFSFEGLRFFKNFTFFDVDKKNINRSRVREYLEKYGDLVIG